MEITASALYGSNLTLDLGAMPETLVFFGNPGQRNSLTVIGSKNDDVFQFHGGQATINERQLAWSDVERIIVDGQSGCNTLQLISDDFGTVIEAFDNRLVMTGGGQRMEFVNMQEINAFATGKRDRLYVFAENDSFLFMNDQYVECRSQDQTYRLWYCEEVTAINADESNSVILHTGSRGYDVYTLAEGYGTATNAVGSYFHEFIGFANSYIFTPMATPTVSLPEDAEWVQEDDRAIWTQNEFTVTILGPAKIVARGNIDVPGPTEEPGEETEPDDVLSPLMYQTSSHHERHDNAHSWDESLCDFLAGEHLRTHRKKDKWLGEDDETDDWLAEFEELALLELMK